MSDIKDDKTFDALKMYYKYDFDVTKGVIIRQPTIGEILEFGDVRFFSVINRLCGNPYMFRLTLWEEMNIDWNKISDFKLFFDFISKMSYEETKLIFKDLNFSNFVMAHDDESDIDVMIYIERDDNGNIVQKSYDECIKINENDYKKLVAYLRIMFKITVESKRAVGREAKEMSIDIARQDRDRALLEEQAKSKGVSDGDYHLGTSFLLPLVSFACNHAGFKYKKEDLKDIGIFEFMDSVSRLQDYEQVKARWHGIFSMSDNSKIDTKDLDFKKVL